MRLSSSVLALMPLLAAAGDVTVEFWTSPKHDWDAEQGLEPGPNVDAYKILIQAEVGFGSAVDFDMNMYINSGNGVCPTVDQEGAELSEEARIEVCNESCIFLQRYCEAPPTDPDHAALTGADLVEEALNRQCVWKNYHNNDDWDSEQKYFAYLEQFLNRGCDTKKVKRCTGNSLDAVEIDQDVINSCIGDVTADVDNLVLNEQIQKQEERGIDQLASLPVILVNGVQLEVISEEAVFKAICDAFPAGTIDVCDGDIEENLGEDQNLEDEKEAEEELVEEIAEELGESEEQVEEEVTGLQQNGDFGLTDEEKKAIMEGEEEELEEIEEEEEELGEEAFEALDEANSEETMPPEAPAEGEAEPAEPSDTADWGAGESPAEEEQQPLEGEQEPSAEFPVGDETPLPRPQVEFPSENAAPQAELPVETSSPQLDQLNSMGGEEPSAQMPAHEEPEPALYTPTPPAPGEGAATATTLDLTLVGTALDHMEALQTCDVDTSLLLDKLSQLATGGQLQTEAEDIESDLPLLMTQNCPHEDGVEILHRLRNFHGCAMFDLQALIETFPSTAVGVAMRCATAYQSMSKEEAESGRIPDACIRTVEASSVLGRGLFGLYLYPDVACPCFEKLGDEIPECTADVWPIPINGALLKVQSCLVGQYCKTIDGLCDKKMKVLNTCLPPRGTKPDDMQCGEIFDRCSEVYEDIHPMLNAAPLPDACIRIAQGSDYYGTHIVERYDVFRHQCGENMELWEGHGKVAEFKSFVTEGIYGIDYQSVPFISGAAGGFIAGIIFTIVFIIVRNICICIKNFICNCCCCGKKKSKRPQTKDYATVEMNGEEIEEYRDEP